jgi:GDP-4-dehydro-6-deoxy-D-mannose reductase
MTRTLVVTGANGFVGSHVVALAAQRGLSVWAVGREAKPSSAVAAHADRYFSADLAEHWPVDGNAEAIVHLAGLAAVGPSFAHPQRYIEINSRIMTNLAETVLASGARPRLIVVSSGAVYAPTPSGTVDERSTTFASSPYVVAKLLVEQQCRYYAGRGLDVVAARPFNHIGPGQSRGFIVPDLTAAVRAATDDEPVRVGNLAARRDYTDVRDVAAAYLTLATAAVHAHDLYNISTGVSQSGEDLLQVIGETLNRNDFRVEIDPARMRPNDPPRIAGDSSRLRDEFGWAPTITWEDSVREYIASAVA